MTVRSIEEVLSIWIKLAVLSTFMFIMTFGSLMYINNYQNKVIEGQRVLIKQMMTNPACLVPSPNKPVEQAPDAEWHKLPGATDFPADEHPTLPDMRREGWFI